MQGKTQPEKQAMKKPKLSIEDIKSSTDVSNKLLSGDSLINKINQEKINILQEEAKGVRQNRILKQFFAMRVFYFMCIWSGLLFSIIIVNGFSEKLDISSVVEVTLAGGTTITTIGLVGFIVQGLFMKNKNSL